MITGLRHCGACGSLSIRPRFSAGDGAYPPFAISALISLYLSICLSIPRDARTNEDTRTLQDGLVCFAWFCSSRPSPPTTPLPLHPFPPLCRFLGFHLRVEVVKAHSSPVSCWVRNTVPLCLAHCLQRSWYSVTGPSLCSSGRSAFTASAPCASLSDITRSSPKWVSKQAELPLPVPHVTRVASGTRGVDLMPLSLPPFHPPSRRVSFAFFFCFPALPASWVMSRLVDTCQC